MHERYARGVAAAIVRNNRLGNTARTDSAQAYHAAVADGLRMSLWAWFALNAAPGTREDLIGEQVRIAVTLAEERAAA